MHITFDYIGPGEGCIVGCLRTSAVDRSKLVDAEAVHVAALDKELEIQGTVKGAAMRNYKQQKGKTAQGFVDLFLGPIGKLIEGWPQYVVVPMVVVIVLPLLVCLMPIVIPLAIFDFLRAMTTVGADARFI